MFRTKTLNTGFSALTILLVVILATSAFAENPMQIGAVQRQVADHLADFKRTAYQLSCEADTLNSRTPTHQLSWQTHAERLTTLKDHVNQLGRTLVELEALKPLASEGQKMAIAHARPDLVSVARNVTHATELVNDSRSNIHYAEYGQAVSNIYAHADALYTKLDTILDHENAKMRLNSLELLPASAEED